MNETPATDAEAASDESPRKGLINNLIVVALVVVGVLGSALMLYQLYGQTDKPGTMASQPPTGGTAASAKSASPVAPGSGLALRLHAFSDVATAEDLRARLNALQIPSSISVEARVQVGPFKTQEEVNAARAKLKELGIYGGELITIK